MNFNIVEGYSLDINSIYDDFEKDYLTTTIPNPQLRVKYNLTHKEFRDLTRFIKQKNNLNKRPYLFPKKYYYKIKYGFVIQKRVGYDNVYIGFVPAEDIAKKMVELCEKLSWDIPVCKEIVKNWCEYV
jgi:hypothetical protein